MFLELFTYLCRCNLKHTYRKVVRIEKNLITDIESATFTI